MSTYWDEMAEAKREAQERAEYKEEQPKLTACGCARCEAAAEAESIDRFMAIATAPVTFTCPEAERMLPSVPSSEFGQARQFIRRSSFWDGQEIAWEEYSSDDPPQLPPYDQEA